MKINLKKSQKIIFIALGVLSAGLGIGMYVHKWESREELLEVHFLSLDRGRSVFIRTPQNKTILIGGGQNSEVMRELTRLSPFYSRRIDMVIAGSAVPAQIGGLIEVIDRYEIEEIIFPKPMATSTVLTQLMKEVRKKKIHVKEVEKGDLIDLEYDIQINVLFPYMNFKYNKTSLPEMGLEIIYKDTGVFLLGNLSKTIQKDIAKNSATSTNENILEYYHSALDSKVSQELLEKVQPKYIFSTNEKTISWTSDGFSWTKGKERGN